MVASTSPSTQTNTALLAKSWTEAASAGYDQLLSPRFAPWTSDALTALRRVNVERVTTATDRGGDFRRACLVPACGPGREIPPLASMLGEGWSILGIDLSPGMVELARDRIANECPESSQGQVQVEVGNCVDILPPPIAPLSIFPRYDVIFSVFGLQQFSDPPAAIRTWVRSVRPGGVAVVSFWPPEAARVEAHDPWVRWEEIVRRKVAGDSKVTASAKLASWDDKLSGAVEEAGGEVLEDSLLSHAIRWDNPEQLWHGMTMAGPWNALRLKRGDAFVDGLRDEYLEPYDPCEPIVHSPSARILVLRRK